MLINVPPFPITDGVRRGMRLLVLTYDADRKMIRHSIIKHLGVDYVLLSIGIDMI